MDFIATLRQKALRSPKRVVLPEADQGKILLAARRVLELGIAFPILIGDAEEVSRSAKSLDISTEGFTVINHAEPGKYEGYIDEFLKVNQDFSAKALQRKMKDPLNFGAMLVRLGKADCLAAGLNHTTGDVILASQSFIGLREGLSTVSSVGILDVPGFAGPEGNLLGIADCAVCPAPNSDELADIAISTADTLKRLLGWEPRVAMLSFSTKGSAEHESVEKVIRAVELVRARRPDLLVDGELQLDSAILPATAAKKIPSGSSVAGKANILIFPDLGAGNIGVKLVQIFAHGFAHGPLLQGFQKPVTDFSRSAPVEEMVGAITMLVVCASGA
jgi:phosphate acetyltransferase